MRGHNDGPGALALQATSCEHGVVASPRHALLDGVVDNEDNPQQTRVLGAGTYQWL